jgi:hypothetical protein
MLRFCIGASDALESLRSEAKGTASFEYVVVAACIVTVVGTAFNAGAGGPIKATLTDALTAISVAFAATVGG